MNSRPTANSLHNFQQGFSKHLRNPRQQKLPKGVPARAATIYKDLVFNNVCGFIDACFPVAKSLFSDSRWKQLCRGFFQEWPSETPYFNKIPEQFVLYMHVNASLISVPAYMPELLHYEWMELEVDTSACLVAEKVNKQLSINPSLQNLQYQWPVHRISKNYRPRKPHPCYLLVYRNIEHRVCFMEINAMTSNLLTIFQQAPSTAQQGIAKLAKQSGYANPDVLQEYGMQLLEHLLQQQILLGTLR